MQAASLALDTITLILSYCSISTIIIYLFILIMGDTKDFQDSLFFGSMTSTKLKGSNYLQWSRVVRVFLTGHGKESYFMTTKPIDATKIPKWSKRMHKL
jgi:hypothetical protein